MKVTPIASPHVMQPTGAQSSSQQATRAKVIAMLEAKPEAPQRQAGEAQVNQNAVSVEELGAIQPPKLKVAEEAAPEETASETTPEVQEEPKQDPALSRQFAQLARQERALRAQKQQFQTEMKLKEADLKARMAELEKQSAPAPDLSNYVSYDQLKQNAWNVLAKAGISYDELTQQALNHQPVNPQVQAHIEALEAKLAKLEALNETSQKTQQEQQENQYKAALTQIETDVTRLVRQDPATYEVIAKTGKSSIKEVVKLIEEVYKKDGYIMDIEEAAQEVENYLFEQSIKTVSRIDKIKKQLATSSAKTESVEKQTPKPPQQPQMKTLTNAASSQRKLTAKERAILAFRGELKS